MEKFIPYEKLSKKGKKKLDQAKRQTWGEMNPVTRKPANSKAYNRKRAQAWKKELPSLRFPFPFFFDVLAPKSQVSKQRWSQGCAGKRRERAKVALRQDAIDAKN